MLIKKFDLEDRLIQFSVSIIKLTDKIPGSYSGHHLSNQLTRSGTSPALYYGEAQSAESRNDFIHKMKISLKELRETNINLKIIEKLNWLEQSSLTGTIRECNELIAIFVKCIQTSETNRQLSKTK
jgi:four helix bundle protein